MPLLTLILPVHHGFYQALKVVSAAAHDVYVNSDDDDENNK